MTNQASENTNSQKRIRKNANPSRRLSQEFLFQKRSPIKKVPFRNITNLKNADGNPGINKRKISSVKELDLWLNQSFEKDKKQKKTHSVKKVETLDSNLDYIPKKTVKFVSTEKEMLFSFGPEAESKAIFDFIGASKQKVSDFKVKFKSACLFWKFSGDKEENDSSMLFSPSNNSFSNSFGISSREQSFGSHREKSSNNSFVETRSSSPNKTNWNKALRSAYFSLKEVDSNEPSFLYLLSPFRLLLFIKNPHTKDLSAIIPKASLILKDSLSREGIKYNELEETNCYSNEAGKEESSEGENELIEYEKNGGEINSLRKSRMFWKNKTLCVEGKKEVHALYDFCQNNHKLVFGGFPDLYSLVPFEHATLEFLKAGSKIYSSLAKQKTKYSLQFDGFLLPQSIKKLEDLMKSKFKNVEIKSTLIPSAEGLNRALTKN